MKIGVSIVICLSWFAADAHQKAIDSLKSLLDRAQTTTHLVKNCRYVANIHLELALEYTDVDFIEASRWVDRAINLRCLDSTKLVKAYRLKGQILNILGRHHEAKVPLRIGYQLCRDGYPDFDCPTININLASAHIFTGDYGQAFELLYRTLGYFATHNNPRDEAVTYWGLGLGYYKLRDYKKALQFYLKCYSIMRLTGIYFQERSLLSNLALCYANLGLYSEALRYLCLINSKSFGWMDNNELTAIEFTRGFLYYKMGINDFAKKCFENSLFFATEENNRQFIAENLVYLADVLIRQNKNADANILLARCKAQCVENSLQQILLNVYRQQIKIFPQDDVNGTTILLNDFITLKKSLYNDDVGREIGRSLAAYYEEGYIASINRHHQSIYTKKRLIEGHELLFRLTVSLMLAGLVLMIIIIKSIQDRSSFSLRLAKSVDRRVSIQNGQIQFSLMTIGKVRKSFSENCFTYEKTQERIPMFMTWREEFESEMG